MIQRDYEIQNLNSSLLHKRILQVSSNVNLTHTDFEEFVTMAESLAPNSTDHSPILFPLLKDKSTIRGIGFWKFNNSLTKSRLRNFCAKSESLFNHELQ